MHEEYASHSLHTDTEKMKEKIKNTYKKKEYLV